MALWRGVQPDFLNGSANVLISAATADVATHQLANICIALGLSFTQQTDGGAYLARSAITALEGVMLDEGSLHGMEIIAFGETFDGGNFRIMAHGGQFEAGIDASSVNQNGACAALAVIASLLGSRQ